jgi:bifunctional DNase/RNase
MEVEVELSKIIINEAVDQQIIVLKELDGQRSFPIVIGMTEILAIDRDLSNGTFYARLHINTNGNTVEVDSRPSDAIALGVGIGVSIFVDEQVFENMQM